MTLYEFKAQIEKRIRPYKYIYENDGKFYYFHIWNWKLKSFTVMIGLKSLKNKDICESKLKYIENKYRSLV